MKHTPTPWHRNVSSRYPIYAGDEEKREWKYVAAVLQDRTTNEEEREANLEFIVRAVNAFYPMLAALKEAREEDWDGLKCQAGCDEAIAGINGTQDSINRAIRLAEAQ